MIGLTIVAFGTSAPEVLVSAVAAATGNPELAIGNAIGSNITNVGLVLGAAAWVRPLVVHSTIVRRELPVLAAVMGLALLLMFDRHLGRVDGLLLLFGMIVFMARTVREGMGEKRATGDPLEREFEAEIPGAVSTGRALGWLVVGLIVLLVGSRLLVSGAIALARSFAVDELVIGLTIVAVGTSLPELAASVMAAAKGEDDIAIGNVVGSNVWNLLCVLGLPGVIAPTAVDDDLLLRDFPVMIGLTAMLLAMSRGFGAGGKLDRPRGSLLLLSFFGYLAYLYFESA